MDPERQREVGLPDEDGDASARPAGKGAGVPRPAGQPGSPSGGTPAGGHGGRR